MSLHFRVGSTDGTLLSLSSWGSTPPSILCIHGYADGRYVWSPFAQLLVQYAGVLTMDMRGHGDSDWDPAGVYTTAKFVADAQAIIDACCSCELLLVGHSLGGDIAIQLAAANKRRVQALVLVDVGPGVSDDGIRVVRQAFRSKTRAFSSKTAYRQELRDSMPLANDEMLELAVTHALTGAGEAYRLKCDPRLGDLELPGRRDKLWPLLESLQIPCLLIRGEASAIVPRHLAAAMTQRVRSLRCTTVTMAGHAVMMDNPQDFGSILQRFVAGIYADSRSADAAIRASAGGELAPPC
jgi:pimeloyl-ACP methyl ester carboxylesterase